MTGEWRIDPISYEWAKTGYPFDRYIWFENGVQTPYSIEWSKNQVPPHISTLPMENPYRNPAGSGQHISSL